MQVPTWLAVLGPTIPPVQVSALGLAPVVAAAQADAQTLLDVWQRLTAPHWEFMLQVGRQTLVAVPGSELQVEDATQSALPLGHRLE